jgi:energy-coupling factor transporter ATP-binding protein EcfA2
MAGRTTLLITHDRSLAALADRTVVLDRGRIVAEHCRPQSPEPSTSPEPPTSPQPSAVARPTPVR